jgi:hypothetical protein
VILVILEIPVQQDRQVPQDLQAKMENLVIQETQALLDLLVKQAQPEKPVI